jgi:hypothetical protein
MNRATLPVLLAVGLSITGCSSEPGLDTSSDEAMAASMEKMQAGLSASRREELVRSIAVLVAPRLAEKAQPDRFDNNPAPASQAELLRPYQGMTADQLIAKAKEQAK